MRARPILHLALPVVDAEDLLTAADLGGDPAVPGVPDFALWPALGLTGPGWVLHAEHRGGFVTLEIIMLNVQIPAALASFLDRLYALMNTPSNDVARDRLKSLLSEDGKAAQERRIAAARAEMQAEALRENPVLVEVDRTPEAGEVLEIAADGTMRAAARTRFQEEPRRADQELAVMAVIYHLKGAPGQVAGDRDACITRGPDGVPWCAVCLLPTDRVYLSTYREGEMYGEPGSRIQRRGFGLVMENVTEGTEPGTWRRST